MTPLSNQTTCTPPSCPFQVFSCWSRQVSVMTCGTLGWIHLPQSMNEDLKKTRWRRTHASHCWIPLWRNFFLFFMTEHFLNSNKPPATGQWHFMRPRFRRIVKVGRKLLHQTVTLYLTLTCNTQYTGYHCLVLQSVAKAWPTILAYVFHWMIHPSTCLMWIRSINQTNCNIVTVEPWLAWSFC